MLQCILSINPFYSPRLSPTKARQQLGGSVGSWIHPLRPSRCPPSRTPHAPEHRKGGGMAMSCGDAIDLATAEARCPRTVGVANPNAPTCRDRPSIRGLLAGLHAMRTFGLGTSHRCCACAGSLLRVTPHRAVASTTKAQRVRASGEWEPPPTARSPMFGRAG